MNEPAALQLILPTDKRNACFTLYLDEAQKEVHVYYGSELLEIVPNESEHSAYKLLAGRHCNAGVKVRDLEEVFGADRKTMRLWGQALRSLGGKGLLVRRGLEGGWQQVFSPELEP